MAPTGEAIKTPEGQPTPIESGPSSEPPFTDAEIAAQNEGSILAGLPGKEEAAKKDGAALEAVEKKFNEQPPPVEFTEEAGAVRDLRDDKAKLAELHAVQQQPGGTEEREQSQPGSETPEGTEPAEEPVVEQPSAERQAPPKIEIPEGQKIEPGKMTEEVKQQPDSEKRPRVTQEAPVRQEADPRQMAEKILRDLNRVIDEKLYLEIAENGGQIPEKSAGLDAVKDVFKNSRNVSPDTIANSIDQLRARLANSQKDKDPKHLPSPEELKTLVKETFQGPIGIFARENPQKKPESPYWKQQDERQGAHESGLPDIPVKGDSRNITPESPKTARIPNRDA